MSERQVPKVETSIGLWGYVSQENVFSFYLKL